MEDTLKQILSELKEFKVTTEKRFDVLEAQALDNAQILKNLEQKVDGISEQLKDLEVQNAERHIDLSRDMKFIKHKLHDTEEDVFIIKDHLKIVK